MASALLKKFLEELSDLIGIEEMLTAWTGLVELFFRKKYVNWLKYKIQDINSEDGIITMFLTISYNTKKGMDMLTDKQVEQITKTVTEKVKKDLKEYLTNNFVSKQEFKDFKDELMKELREIKSKLP